MANIEIFPLSVNGIAPPLNLLSQAFKNRIDPKFLFYPLDLAANPNYGHAIQFTAYKTKYNVRSTVNGLINGTESFNFNSIAQIVNPTNWKVGIVEKPETTISLYMPDTLTMNYSHDWSQVSLTQTLGPASYIGSAMADWADAKYRGGSTDAKGNAANLYGKGLAVGAAQMIGDAGIAGTGSDLGSLVGNILGQVPNPQLQMLYKGTELREFQFQFKFTPASKKEAMEIERIIQLFQFHSAPRLLGSVSHQYLEPPELFKIDFLFVGGTGLESAVSNFFKNLGTNILTSQLYSGMFGGMQQGNLDPENNKAKVFQIYNPCALKDISLDYAPNGWAAHEDGAPVETTMTLTFKEVDIVTKDNIQPPSEGFGPIGDVWRNVPNIFKNPY